MIELNIPNKTHRIINSNNNDKEHAKSNSRNVREIPVSTTKGLCNLGRNPVLMVDESYFDQRPLATRQRSAETTAEQVKRKIHPHLARFCSIDPTNETIRPLLMRSVSRNAEVLAKVYSLPDEETIVLGSFMKDTKYIIEKIDLSKQCDIHHCNSSKGELGLLNLNNEIAYKCRDFWEDLNKPWLKKMADKGCTFLSASSLHDQSVRESNGNASIFSKEINYLNGRADYLYCDVLGKYVHEKHWNNGLCEVFYDAEED